MLFLTPENDFAGDEQVYYHIFEYGLHYTTVGKLFALNYVCFEPRQHNDL